MTSVTATEELSSYNRTAIDIAARIHELRRQDPDVRDRAGRPLDQVVPALNRSALGVYREYERMGNQPVTDELQAEAERFGVRFEHLGLTLGTVLHDIDLRTTPSPEVTAFIRRTLLERKVIFFRDQHLDPSQQVAFGRCFGQLDAFPFGQPGQDPFIVEIVHGPGFPGTENGWHSDVTWMENPSLGSIAQCVEVPPIGGDTLFSDSHAAYDGMTAQLRERVEHLHGINDYRVFLQGRSQSPLPTELIDAIKQEIPFGVHHPIVRTHPETGKQALYLNGGFLRHDSLYDSRTGQPLDPDESVALAAELMVQHSRPEYICRFRWTPGSIAFWDNRAVQHYAASDYYPHRRVLRRVTVSGDRPFHRPGSTD